MFKKKNLKGFSKKALVLYVAITTILGMSGPVLAASPTIGHCPLNQISGTAGDGGNNVSSTASIIVFAGDDSAVPGVDLVVTANYKNSGYGSYTATTCDPLSGTSNLHKCNLTVSGTSTDPRIFKYYLKATDGAANTYVSWATDTDNLANAQSYPIEAKVYSWPWWNNTFIATSTKGVRVGKCYNLTTAAAAGQNTLLVSQTQAADLGRATSTWILVNPNTATEKKFKVIATSTDGTTMTLTLSGNTEAAYALPTCVEQYLSGARVWLEGAATSTVATYPFANLATVSAYDSTAYNQISTDATSTFGGFTLSYIPNGTWSISAFKDGYGYGNLMGYSVTGSQNINLPAIILGYGGGGGGGNVEGAYVTWTAPGQGMMGAGTNIDIGAGAIKIAFSGSASSSSITTSNIEFKIVNPDGTTTNFPSYYAVGYEEQNANFGAYDFGPDAKAIIYSSSTLATSTSYMVRLTPSVRDANNNPIQSNEPGGGYVLSFSTGGAYFSGGGVTAGNFAQGGATMPPFVNTVLPGPGSINTSQNTKILIEFSQAMDSTTLASNIELWQLNANFSPISQITMAANTPALSQLNNNVVVVTPANNLSQARYRIIVKGGIRSSSGMTMSPPDMTANTMFTSEFEVGAGADISVPTVVGTNLDMFLSGGNYTNVPTYALFKVAFSEPVDPDTINTSNIYIRAKGSTSNISGTAEYDLMEGKAIFVPTTAINGTSTYTLNLTAGIKDLTSAQNALATTTYTFTTAGMDIVRPRLQFGSADNYKISITFSEPMNASQVTDTNTWSSGSTKWQTSVLNPANYIVNHRAIEGQPGENYINVNNTSANLSASTIWNGRPNNVTLSYDPVFFTLEIEGLALEGNGFSVRADNVTDISGNVLQSSGATSPVYGENMMGGPIMGFGATFGTMGPGGGMFAPPTLTNVQAGTMAVTDFGGKDPRMMGMMPVGVWPMNMMAGATSIYMIDIPISLGKAILAGGKIVLGPFPDESNVSGAKNADKDAKFAHYDINGPSLGKVVIDTTTVETSGGTSTDGVTVSGQNVTVTLGTVATQAPDFIHLELDGIRNPVSPTMGGYKINIQTQNAGGTALESFTSMPFFIMPKGKYNIIGHATSTTAGDDFNGIKIFGGSPSTGPLFVATANNAFGSSTNGEFQIEGLNRGDVMLMTEPYIAIGSNEYIAPMPAPIFLDDATTANTSGAAMAGVTGCTSQTACYYYKSYSLTKVTAGSTPALLVYIYGDFSATSANIDVFAGGPNGFRVKEVTLNANYSVTPYKLTLNLPATGDYNVGVGPAAPKGPMGMGGAPMPTGWIPPKPIEVSVSGSGGTWTWDERDSASTATSTSDGLIAFTIAAANKTIIGHVYDTSSNPVSNAEVFAYSPTEMFGTGTHVLQNGTFTLNVKDGFYKVGAFLPGAPPTGEVGVEVKSSDPAGTFYVDGVVSTDLILKIGKNIQSGYTISGTVYSDTASKYPATDVSVYTYRTDGPGHAETMTDSKGTYTLYVGPGTWKVGASLSGYGKVTEQTITVPPSKSGLNFTPNTTTNYPTIRERIWEDKDNNGIFGDGEGIARATVSFVSTSTDYVNTAITDENGLYELKVPATTTYDIYVWSPDLGNFAPEKNKRVTSTDIIYTSFSGWADVSIEHATTVEIGFYDSAGNSTTADKALIQLDKIGAIGVSNDVYKESIATTTLKVSTSTTPYIFDLEVQGVPKNLLTITPLSGTAVGTSTLSSKLFSTTTIDGYEKIKVILPPLTFVSGQVQDSLGVAVPNAVLHIEQPGTDVEFDVEANASGNYAFKVASSTTAYLIQADKGGYIDSAVSVYASTTSLTFNPVIEAANYTISGTVTINGSLPSGTSIYVWAEKLGGGYGSTASGDPQTGTYSLSITNGDWEIAAAAEGYSAKTEAVIVHVSGSNVSGKNFNITASQTLQEQETLGMGGNVGGTLTDREANFEMSIPRSTISASDSSSYSVGEKNISNIPTYTPTGNLIGNDAIEVSAYKPSGSGGNATMVSGLNGAAFIDKTLTITELATEGIDTLAEVEEVKMGYYDSSSQNWKNVPTTITYLNFNDQPVVPTTTDLAGVQNVIFNGVTKHFSTFGVINSKYDGLAPAAPSSVTVSQGQTGIGQLVISWSGVTTNIDGTTATDIQRYAIYRSDGSAWTKITTVSTTTTSYIDTLPKSGVYYYRVTADSGLQSEFSGTSSGVPTFAISGGTPAPSAPAAPAVEAPAAEAEVPKKIVMAPEAEAPVPAEIPTKEEITLEGIIIPTLEKPVSQMTAVELQTKITEFITVINQLKALISKLQEAEAIPGIPADYKFEKILKFGQISDDVKYLQIVLNSDSETRLAESGVGSPGKETNYFGNLTKTAVIKFQKKYSEIILTPWGLTQGTGLVGSTTRTKMNELLGR